jgi:hypothetical protein
LSYPVYDIVSSKEDIKNFKLAIKLCTFPVKPQFIDISLREPVTHRLYMWPVSKKIEAAMELYKNVKPKEVTGMALYSVDAAPAFGYPERKCIIEEEIKFIKEFKNRIVSEDRFEVLRTLNKKQLRGVYAMTEIDRI